ncbi:MAG: hypothetical protein H0W18_11495 [Acidobacteria bacterium]|nr:hypothetical protein [Acidobacteriota bacterium]
MDAGPACQAFWNVDAVFDATVLSIASLPRTETIGTREVVFRDKLVTLQVHRSWKGQQPAQVEVTTAWDGAGCGYPFEAGERYLVFANGRSGSRPAVSRCNRTSRFAEAGQDLEFLDSLAAPPRGARVFGTVQTNHRTFQHTRPIDNIPTETIVRLTGMGRDLSMKSSGGRYEFAGLEDGWYRLEIDVPAGYRTYEPARDVRLANRHACVEVNQWFSPDGRIGGQLVRPDGKPAGSVRVEITGAETQPHRDWGLPMEADSTDADGFFEFGNLPPGRYIVGLNFKDLPSDYNPYARVIYPGPDLDPHIIEIALGQTVDLGTWQVPAPLPVVRVEGIVVLADGAPVPGVYVGAWDETGNPVERARGAGGATTGPDGRFVLKLRKGRIYEFTVRDKQPRFLRTDARRINTAAGSIPLRIMVVDEKQ